MSVFILIKGAAATQAGPLVSGNQIAQPLSQNNPNSPASAHAFQVNVTGAVGSTATVQFMGSNDGINFDAYGATIAATVTVSDGSAGTKTGSGTTPFTYIGAKVTAISGTGAKVDALVSA